MTRRQLKAKARRKIVEKKLTTKRLTKRMAARAEWEAKNR
mgnify:CR=1 FL=1